jgi:hypothetical protein
MEEVPYLFLKLPPEGSNAGAEASWRRVLGKNSAAGWEKRKAGTCHSITFES